MITTTLISSISTATLGSRIKKTAIRSKIATALESRIPTTLRSINTNNGVEK